MTTVLSSMNVKKQSGNRYKLYEGKWRTTLTKKEPLDSRGESYPWPTERVDQSWVNRTHFIRRLGHVEGIIKSKSLPDHKCLICHQKIEDAEFKINNMFWYRNLSHYLEKHDVRPTEDFEHRIFMYRTDNTGEKKKMRLNSRVIQKYGLHYIKIEGNQLSILDALLINGGVTKFHDGDDPDILRFAEHSGMLDFDRMQLERIIISGKPGRVDDDDNNIFLPSNDPSMLDYEYMFHTHPPTPNPGSRAIDGILYEFPSIGDLFHFIDFHKRGAIQGSLVITPEGLYNVHRHPFNNQPLDIDEEKFFDDTKIAYDKVLMDSYSKYGYRFTPDEFFERIASDRKWINELNKTLNKYSLHIDYYPRSKDKANNWTIGTVYLPVYPVN